MPAIMARTPKKTGGEDEQSKKQARSGAPLHAWIEEAIMAALDAYLEGTDPRISKTAFVEMALRKALRDVGCWPPKKEGE